MYEARWNDRQDFMVFSNTVKGVLELLNYYVPRDETGTIYLYKDGELVSKSKQGRFLD